VKSHEYKVRVQSAIEHSQTVTTSTPQRKNYSEENGVMRPPPHKKKGPRRESREPRTFTGITAYIDLLLLRLAERRYVLVVVLHPLINLCLGLLR
jgi:hypothetical protein